MASGIDMTKQQGNIKLQALIAAFREYNERNNTHYDALVLYDDLSGHIEGYDSKRLVPFANLDQLLALLAEKP